MNADRHVRGELRFARDTTGRRLPSGVHARLVLVVDVIDPDVAVCLLVTEEVHNAGSADLVLGERETGLDAVLCVQTDLAVSLAGAQLGPVMGRLDGAVLDVVLQTFTDGEVPTGRTADGMARGLPIGTPADPRWQGKLDELEDVRVLGEAVAARLEAATEPERRFPDDIDQVLRVWETTIARGSGLASAMRSTALDTPTVEEFDLPEQVFVDLVGRARLPHEDRPMLRVLFVVDPARIRIRLVVAGRLSDTVDRIVVVVTGADGEVPVVLDLDDRDDPVFEGEAAWPTVGPAATPPALRMEVTRR